MLIVIAILGATMTIGFCLWAMSADICKAIDRNTEAIKKAKS